MLFRSMTLVWLLLSTASIFTLKQYAQKNLELTAATMGRSLEAALVFGDSAAAEETLASLGKFVLNVLPQKKIIVSVKKSWSLLFGAYASQH